VRQSLAPHRLRSQRLVGEPLPDPAAVVRHLGAVQSQEHTTVPWSIARRCGSTSQAEVLEGLESGGVVRTHALRTTWHHVHLDDLPTVVAATGDRVMGQLVPHVRRQGLDEETLVRASELVTQAVRERPGCTRDDLAVLLAEAGHPSTGDLLAHVVMAAELRGEVAGRRDPGGPHRYRPLPDLDLPGTDTARSRLAASYVRGHGPSSDADLAWWSSLTLTQARRALAEAGLHEVEVGGERLWSDLDATALEAERVDPPPALLLTQFDELVSHARDARVRAEVGPLYQAVMFGYGLVVLDGRLAGHWSREVRASTWHVTVTTSPRPSPTQRRVLEQEAGALARFHGLDDVVVSLVEGR
jgi:hypothetical protein